jgi:nucleoside-diphosphate-sugar epimerase
VTDVAAVIAAMRAAVPPGRETLHDDDVAELRRLTELLVADGGGQELSRFLAVRDRDIAVPHAQVGPWLQGRTVLVTGGTGCIGTELMTQIARYEPRHMVSVSRGLSHEWPRLGSVEYTTADVTDAQRLASVFGQVRPDVVFHLAAQRDPGLAELEIHRTVRTNIFGVLNVIEMAERSGVSDVVVASTGKAIRPYSPEAYTSSKRTAEWLLARAADTGQCRYSAVRFTHVVDNSIIYRRLRSWCQSGVIRLHDPDSMFYVQSARESAEALLFAGLSSRLGGLHILAQTDLGWPISVLDLAVGILADTRSRSPIYFCGHDPGYEGAPFPGLYDPRTAGQVSPLVNGFEALDIEQCPDPMLDILPVRQTPCPNADSLLSALSAACQAGTDPDEVRAALAELAWSIFDGAMSVTRLDALTRARKLTEPHLPDLSAEHREMLAVITRHEKARELAPSAAGAWDVTSGNYPLP